MIIISLFSWYISESYAFRSAWAISMRFGLFALQVIVTLSMIKICVSRIIHRNRGRMLKDYWNKLSLSGFHYFGGKNNKFSNITAKYDYHYRLEEFIEFNLYITSYLSTFIILMQFLIVQITTCMRSISKI